MGPSAASAKRLLDLVVSAGGLLLGSPVLLLAALAIKLDSKGPVLHRDLRVGPPWPPGHDPVHPDAGAPDATGRVESAARIGARGRPFELLKFRVLGRKERSLGRRPGEHPRLTRVGRVLRRTGLEDWPQLINVLRGHMSLVGPRAATPQCIDRMARECPAWRPRESRARPGIFGFAQLDRPEGGGFFAAVCEKLLFDVVYDRQQAQRGALAAVLDDLALVATSLERRLSSHGRPVGNDVIRIDHPLALRQVPLDPHLLARRSPVGLSTDVVEGDRGVTSYWYLPRRRAGPTPVADAEMLDALCDDVSCAEGKPLVLAKALRPSGVPDVDVVALDLPTSLHELHSVCEHLQLFWEALAPRSEDEHFTLSMTFVVVEALATAARSLGNAEGRLGLTAEVGERELRLRVAARPRRTARPGLPEAAASV